MPCKHLPKIDFIHKQATRPLLYGGSHFVMHKVRDVSHINFNVLYSLIAIHGVRVLVSRSWHSTRNKSSLHSRNMAFVHYRMSFQILYPLVSRQLIDSWDNFNEILNILGNFQAGDKLTLVRVMAWCRWTTNLCLSRCWRRSMSPYGVTIS